MKLVALAALIGAAIVSQGAVAHGPSKDGSSSTASTGTEEVSTPFGRPGEPREIVWTFDKPGEIGFACLTPGHFEAGMTGKVIAK